MAQRAPFKKCSRCGAKIPLSDGHTLCLYCLGESHTPGACGHCQKLSSQALKNRRHRLNTYLLEKSLLPSEMEHREEQRRSPSPSGSTTSAPKAKRQKAKKSVPTKKSKHSPTRQPSPAPSQRSVQSVNLSPVRRSPSPRSEYSSDSTSLPTKQHTTEELRALYTSANRRRDDDPRSTGEQHPHSDDDRREGADISPRHQTIPSLPGCAQFTPMFPQYPPSLWTGFQMAPRDPSGWRAPANPESSARAQEKRKAAQALPHRPSNKRTADGSTRPSHTEPKPASKSKEQAEVQKPPKAPPAVPSRESSLSAQPQWQPFPSVSGFHPYPTMPPGPYPPVPFWPPFWPPASPSVPDRHDTEQPRTERAKKRKRQKSLPKEVPSQSPSASDHNDSSSASSDEDEGAADPEVHSQDSDVGDTSPLSSSGSIPNYPEFVARMAKAIQVPIHHPEPQHSDHLFDEIAPDSSAPAHLGLLPALLSLAKASFQKIPSSSRSRRLENFYRVFDEQATFLVKHPLPNSDVVSASQMQSKSKEVPVPPTREGRKIDTMARQLYSASALAFKIANYQAAMGAYQRVLLKKIKPALETASEDTRATALATLEESLSLAAQQMRSAKHASDMAARCLGVAVAFRRHAWLRSSTLTDSTRAKIERQPFEGDLFHSKTDELMNDLNRSHGTAKRLSHIQNKPQSSFRPQWRKSYSQHFTRQQQRDTSFPSPSSNSFSSRDKSSKPRFRSSSKQQERKPKREF